LNYQLYIGTRWLTLTLVIIDFVAFNVRNGIDCQVWDFDPQLGKKAKLFIDCDHFKFREIS
jgi:hypothetical protein